MDLRSILGALVASVGATSACGGSDDNEACPHDVTIRSFEVQLTNQQACDLIGQPVGNFTACDALCNDPAVTQCILPVEYSNRYWAERQEAGALAAEGGSDGGIVAVCATWTEPSSVALGCRVTETRGKWQSGCPVEGRRPDGLQSSTAGGSTLGRYFAHCAHLEAASVIAFRTLHRELSELGAPPELLDEIAVAEKQEVRHAALAGHLAGRFGGTVPPVEVDAPVRRSIEQIALENVVEGLVRETFGAAVALWRAKHAEDAELRRIFTAIAEDECSHAELSEKLASWLHPQLGQAARDRLESARRSAIAELEHEMSGETQPVLRQIAGVPSARESRALLDELRARVWFSRESGAHGQPGVHASLA